jgi:pimeloyl-ACP methyl ester carboxylesterase
MARATLNGIAIDYTLGGNGRPVILSHGYGATGRMWDGQRRTIGDRYRLITWDMRGHGQTESPENPAQYSTELTVADIRALLTSLGAGRAVVGGLSLGGYMSLAFYLAHPEMVEALIICDSGPGYRNADARTRGTSAPTSAPATWKRAGSRRSAAVAGKYATHSATTRAPRGSRTRRGACWRNRIRG